MKKRAKLWQSTIQNSHARYSCTALFALLTLLSCVREEQFDAIETNIAWPIDIEVSRDGSTFYALNADSDRVYNQGSVLFLDEDAAKLGSLEVPRLGRVLKRRGNVLLAGFDSNGVDPSQVLLIDISDPRAPAIAKTFDLADRCSPINFAVNENSDYFAVNCILGTEIRDVSSRLLVGKLQSDLSGVELKHVRTFSITRRAMIIDPTRNLLISFPSDPRGERLADSILEDKLSFDAKTGESTDGPNEVPDEIEDSEVERRQFFAKRVYQMHIYDFAAQEQEGFPEVLQNKAEIEHEFKWIYYSATSSDGVPDPTDTSFFDETIKHYRSNFWEAVPDIDSSNKFYISHHNDLLRGLYANDIIEMTIVNDIPTTAEASVGTKSTDFISFKRVYGFLGEVQPWHYPSDISLNYINGVKVLFINHFKDLERWPRDNIVFSIGAKALSGIEWFEQVVDTSAFNSYYQIAANDNGVIMSCSFYGNAIMRLKVEPGKDSIELRKIE